jgi:phage baseplate assembly protein W
MPTPAPFVGPGNTDQVDFTVDTSGTELGIDLSALSNGLDLDPKFPTQTGYANLGEAIARRLSTPRGGLFYAPNYGTDIRDRLNDSVTSDSIGQIQAAVEAEALKDDRVLSAACVANYTFATNTLTLQLQLATASGPYRLVLAVTNVSVTLLNGS